MHNFNLFTGSLTYGVQYDGFSVMHYGSKAFSNYAFGNGNTIESKVLVLELRDHASIKSSCF